ncbi:MAG: hypothetical protein HOW73_09475 [Polyangiaceae bacterium]|nr:hypothetical protein [Polyangiaceae bacterium]
MTTIWRAGTELLVADGEAFALIDATGEVTKRLERRRQYSDEDDLWTWEHVVENGRFIERTTIERFRAATVDVREEVLLEGLVPIGDDETFALVEAALVREANARKRSDTVTRRDAERRVEGIDGALDDYQLGTWFARAQSALIRRVRTYADEYAMVLLRTLVSVARAQPGPAVIRAYARGCLLACFERGELPALPEDEAATVHPIADELMARALDLEQWGEAQSAVDARLNAETYSRAAHAVALAARLAGHAPSSR